MPATVGPRRWYFVTHPNVVVDASVPVPRWPLSTRGLERMRTGLRLPWLADIGSIHCSKEQKSIDGAAIWAQHLGIDYTCHDDLGENDRLSTGFLPPAEFERMADAFFAEPEQSVRGWERAVDAQRRIVAAVERLAELERADGDVVIVSHGAVGTLLYCYLAGLPIDRRWDQPPNGGGNWFMFTLEPRAALSHWRPIDPERAT